MLDTVKRLVVVTGRGHAGVVNILEYARASIRQAPIHAVLGGLHLFGLDEASLEWTAGRLKARAWATCSEPSARAWRRSTRSGRGWARTGVVGAASTTFDLEAENPPGTIAL